MSKSLILTLILVSLFLLVLTTIVLKKGRIPEKYALLWYAMALVILLVALIPNVFTWLSILLGFKVMSNLMIGIFIGLLLILVMALTIIISGQKKKTTLLIQEISILKSEMEIIKKEIRK